MNPNGAKCNLEVRKALDKLQGSSYSDFCEDRELGGGGALEEAGRTF